MLSVLIAARNSRERIFNLLQSLLRSFEVWSPGEVEYVLVDDCSLPAARIPELFAEFRRQLPPGQSCRELLFHEHQHYTRCLAYGFSVVQGEHVLFVSHDMLVTPDYVRVLLEAAARHPEFGLVRGVSPYVDAFPQHVVPLPLPPRDIADVFAFARYVATYWKDECVEDSLLTGDSMLVTRAALQRVGTFDPRFFGYFGDIDFGLRLQRAGLRLGCAKGAWLWHEGAGAYVERVWREQVSMEEVMLARMEVVRAAYRVFSEKWGAPLPPEYEGAYALPLAELCAGPAPAGGDFQPLLAPPSEICTLR